MSIYKDYFENIIPEKDNRQFSDSIINSKKTKIRINGKKITALIVAAVTTAAITITGYASGWDYGAVFGQIFGEKAVNIEPHIVSEATEICDDIDHLDFEVVAAAADRQSVHIIVDIIPQRDVLLEKLTIEQYEEYLSNILDDLKFGAYYDDAGAGTGSYTIIDRTDEKLRISYMSTHEGNLNGQKVMIYAHGRSPLSITGINESGFYTGNNEYWRAEFTADLEGKELEYPADLTYTGNYGGTFHINKIVVTPIGIYACGDKNNNRDLLSVKEEYSLNIEHKNTYPVINNGENTNEKEISAENRLKYYSLSSNYLGENIGEDMIALIFREPINPEDITAVVIDGTVIELK